MTLVRLDLRELWMSFRLLAIVTLLLLCGVVAVLAPALDPRLSPVAVFSAALTVAVAVAAGVSAHSIAADRSGGAAAWLVARAISRSSGAPRVVERVGDGHARRPRMLVRRGLGGRRTPGA